MIVVKKNDWPENRIECGKCHSVLDIEAKDLQWTHCEPDMYYVQCPVCGKIIWIENSHYWYQMWLQLHKKD